MQLSRTGNGYVIKGSCILVVPFDDGWQLRQAYGQANRQWLELHGLDTIVFPTLQSLRQLLGTLPSPPRERTYTRLTVLVDGRRYELKRVVLAYEVVYILFESVRHYANYAEGTINTTLNTILTFSMKACCSLRRHYVVRLKH